MIIPVTLNPALDKTLVLNRVSMGEVNRVDSTRNDMGGKGINVSKVLKELGMISAATGFLGGILEEIFRKELNNDKLDVKVEKLKDDNVASMAVLSEENRRMQELMKMYGLK